MTRKPLVAGNWKMNKTTAEATDLAQQLSYRVDQAYEGVDILVCPPFTDLRSVYVTLDFDKSRIAMGAQNVYFEESGAYTGEISPVMLKEIGCSYCIVGHSERRGLFNETNDDINHKVRALQSHGITPLLCVGESLQIRQQRNALEFISDELRACLLGNPVAAADDLVVAYEPIWAIGTGHTATPEQAQDVCGQIREDLANIYSPEIAEQVRILYGGSMNEGNAALFAACPDIDGGLIGGASLDANKFMPIVDCFR
ncbi:MAG: triose-phosphate isomerase [Coriobacteriales bacterium]|jgi:triosephosphate isomerase|nr:triose-phosphate isomerase [Coriobacteriales bacterium]